MPRVLPIGLLALALLWGCPKEGGAVSPPRPPRPECSDDPPPTTWSEGSAGEEKALSRKRMDMVRSQLASRDIDDQRVLDAMSRVPRHRFVKPSLRRVAYSDRPLPHGCRQTVSQPYIVALMTQAVRPGRAKRALDIGTGSGYQAAVLAELVEHVYSVEILCELADTARARLADLGTKNVTIRCGDGFGGWPEHAPYDVIVVAAAPAEVPKPLIDQLAVGGRLVIPVGSGSQHLLVLEKGQNGGIERRNIAPVRFVPMTR